MPPSPATREAVEDRAGIRPGRGGLRVDLSPRAALAHPVGRTVATRLVGIPVTGASALLTSALVVRSVGYDAYGSVALLLSLSLLVPVNDFGLASTLIMAASRRADGGERASRELLCVTGHALRRTLQIAATLSAASAAAFASGAYGRLFSSVPVAHFPFAVLLASVVWSLTIPTSLGLALLTAHHRTFLNQLLQSANSPATLLLVVVARGLPSPVVPFAVAPFAAQVCTGLVAWRVSGRYGAPGLRESLRVGLSREHREGRRTGYALSGAVVSNATAVAYQSDRYVVQDVLGITQVANYSAVAQLYQPLYSLIAGGGQSLWPIFLRSQHLAPQVRRRQSVRYLALFVALGLVVGAGCVVVGPVVARVISGGQARGSLGLSVAFGVLLVVQGLTVPLNSALTSTAGYRYQAYLSGWLLVASVTLSIVLARWWGPTGPVYASAIATLLTVAVPSMRWLWKDTAQRRDGGSQALA